MAFVLFAAFIAVLVTVCVRQDVPLVSREYYQEELDYQQQIDRMENASALLQRPSLQLKDRNIEIQYAQLPEVKHGELKLFRPSDARLDKRFVLPQVQAAQHDIPVADLTPGMYRARLTWEQAGKAYYIEQIIVL